jgi:parallel beta-helix repeat protein
MTEKDVWTILAILMVFAMFVVMPSAGTVSESDGNSSSATIYVPDDYPTIQAAVDAASTGDTIIVRAGEYRENIVVNKRLTIKSENGSGNCIVEAEDRDDDVFEVTADYVNIAGFRVENATGSSKAGIYLYRVDQCNISNNNVKNNHFGIRLYASGNSIINDNNASNNYDGIYLSYSNNNMFYLNNFINNSDNVYSYKSANIFNSSSKINYTYHGNTYTNYTGNYWSDYKGSDVDDDGIGDIPYSINLDNDSYPLMVPFENYFAPTSTPLPDLIVEDTWIEPVEFNPGEEVKLYARIKNIGDADAVGKFWWNRYIDSNFINRYYRNDLAAGDSKTTYKKYIWPTDCNSHTYKVVVDAEGNITESNEGNNERSKRFSAIPVPSPSPTPTPSPTPPNNHNLTGPDLEVTNVKAIGVRISMPSQLFPGGKINVDAVNVNFTVKNTGNEPVTGKFHTEIYVYGTNKIERVETTHLAPGESFIKSVVLICPFAELRTKPVIVKVDTDNVIVELDEENNVKVTIAVIP